MISSLRPRTRRHKIVLAAASFALLAGQCATALIAQTKPAKEVEDLQHWRKAYSDNLMKRDGWLALVALEWLQDGDSSVGSAADNKIKLKHVPAHLGVLRQHNGHVELVAPHEGVQASVLLDGKAATGVVNVDDSEHPSVITTGDVIMTVIHRGDRYYLRVKDAYSPTRLRFHGLNWYAENPALRVTAKWVPYPTPKTLRIVNVLGQTNEEPSPGYAEFQFDGKTVRLEPTVEGDTLFFDFRDTTSKTTTDGAGRFLNTAFPSNGIHSAGTVVIDFNYAHNPPCGYAPYATCPLPTESNRLTVAIPAGEKRYSEE